MKLRKSSSQGGLLSSLGIICTFILTVIPIFSCKSTINMEIKRTVIYYHGKQKEIKPTDEIKTATEECLDSVVDFMKLIITNDRIKYLKENFSGIEIIFSDEIEYKLKPLGRNVKFDRIFIPTSGKFNGVLFLGNEHYGYSPYPPYGLVKCKIKEVIKNRYSD